MKPLPSNLDAEAQVLGAMLVSADAVGEATDLLRPDDFYGGDNRAIFEAMLRLFASGAPTDPVSVAAELRGSHVEPVYLSDLSNGLSSARAVAHHAALVSDAALRRRVIEACQQAQEAAYDGDDVRERAEAAIFAATEGRRESDVVTLGDAVSEVLDDLEKADQGIVPSGIPTGIGNIDRLLGGVRRGTLTIIGARPSVGKSALVGNIASQAAAEGFTVLFVSVEMGRGEVGARMIAALSGVDMNKALRHGAGSQWPQVSEAAARLDALPVHLMDAPGSTVVDIRSRARRIRPDVIIVDYLQLMETHAKGDRRDMDLAIITRSLKLLSREVDAAVLLCSQLNRNAEMDRRKPRLSDLRESGAIEQDADQVWFLHRPDDDFRDPQPIEVIVAKNRNGPRGHLELAYYPTQTLFRDPLRSSQEREG